MKRFARPIFTHTASVLAALSLVLLGFAHRPTMFGGVDPSADYSAGAAYFASADSYCGAGPSQPKNVPVNDCPVCTLAKVMSLAAAMVYAPVPLGTRSVAVPLDQGTLVAAAALHVPPARGPPVVS